MMAGQVQMWARDRCMRSSRSVARDRALAGLTPLIV